MEGQENSTATPRVYVVAASMRGPVKIGMALDMAKRLAQLQTSSPWRLRVYGVSPCTKARELELAMHGHFAHLRMSGEWFDVTVPEALDGLGVVQFGQEQWDWWAPIEYAKRALAVCDRQFCANSEFHRQARPFR